MKPKFLKEFNYSNDLNEEAQIIGAARMESNKHLQSKGYYLPLEYDVRGVLGELILLEFCRVNNIEYSEHILLSDKPVKEKDIILKGKHYVDVKCIGEETNVFSIKFKAHNHPNKYITDYFFVKLLGDNKCNIYCCPKLHVDYWKEQQYESQYGEQHYYSHPI